MSDSLNVEAWVTEARRVAHRSSPCPAARDDLAQETLVRALAHPPARADADSSFGAWLERICRNLRVDDWRAATRARGAGDRLPTPVPATTGEESLLARERRLHVRRALVGLPRPQRRALILRFFGGWSFDRIGARLGLPEATARTRVHRALLALRSRMAALRAWIIPSLPAFKPALAALVVLAAQPRAPESAIHARVTAPAPDGARAGELARRRRRAGPPPAQLADLRLALDDDKTRGGASPSPRAVSDGARRTHATRAQPPAAATEATSTAAVKRYDFDDDQIEGDGQLPGIDIVEVPAPSSHTSLIELRPHFLPEVIKTLENL